MYKLDKNGNIVKKDDPNGKTSKKTKDIEAPSKRQKMTFNDL